MEEDEDIYSSFSFFDFEGKYKVRDLTIKYKTYILIIRSSRRK